MSFLRHLRTMLWLDLRQAWHGRLIHVCLGIGLVFGLAVRFALPAQLELGDPPQVADLTEDGRFGEYFAEHGLADAGAVHDSLEALEAAVAADPDAIGLALTGTPAAPGATMILQGHEPETTVVALRSGVAGIWAENGVSRPRAHRLTVLRPEQPRPPFNLSMIPMLLTIDVLVVGFFFGGVMVLQDRSLGAVGAYRVTPGGTGVYLASKILVNVILALVYTALLLVIAPPQAVPLLSLIAVVCLSSALLTTVGIGVAVFFRTLSSFFYPASLISLVLSAAMPAYFFPAFNTPWIRALPTYQAMFTLRELLLPSGRPSTLGEFCLAIGAGLAVALVLTTLAVDRRLLREA